MSRAFWMVLGAAGGIVAYRKGTRAAARARELGPLGSAQVAAAATSRLAGRTANGLGRLNEIKARREGRLLTGTVTESAVVPVDAAAAEPIPTVHSTAGATPRTVRHRRGDPAAPGPSATTRSRT